MAKRSAKKLQRFDFTMSDDDFEEMSKPYVPSNTKASNSWALRVFSEWYESRIEHRTIYEACDSTELLLTDNKTILSKCLSRFIMEARKENGEHYPPKSIHLILMGLQRFIREKKPQKPLNIRTDDEFYQLRNVCDRHY